MKLATKEKAGSFIARPLKVLVPLIQTELTAGQRAGLEHYRRAGQMLNEARDQVGHFKWGTWLTKNFELSRYTANRYMRLAQQIEDNPSIVSPATQSTMRDVMEPNYKAARAVWASVKEATKGIDIETFTEAKQARTEEIQLHRDLALELIDIGYKALATRLHPDRGGSQTAMRRLNRVRDELKDVAATRRFDQ